MTGAASAWGADRAIALTLSGPVTGAACVKWAIGELGKAIPIRPDAKFRVQLAGPESRTLPEAPESFSFLPGPDRLDVAARDARGMVYAILELAARAGQEGFGIAAPLTESPANAVRSVARCFVSDVEDKPWFNDRDMWPAYLSMLAAQRFNRFNFTLGIGYDFARQIRDCYFHFPYPFLLPVKGYDVRAKGLPDEERDRNLETLKFIARETVARGLDFHLGLWTHAYQWADSPNANYLIEGLSAENHAAYCRDALRRVLEEVPQISGLTFRVHGESGVAEGSYDFWKTLFGAAVATGRKISIDMHAKGIDQRMIDTALATGLPVTVSPKFMAEHMGLPYQQAGIRELEMPPREAKQGFFALSDGERKFMRYSYGDLFDEKRKYSVMFRIWPGTQRMLLWGDPEFASAYGKAFQFCGASGVELCEPLSFKGRKGGGLPGGRTGYLDSSSLAPKWDWQKFEYSYKLWGRMLYNPATPMKATGAGELALAYASRILPLITSAHGPSAANNNYWPEMYTNMSIVDSKVRNPYSDSPAPRRFGTVSAFDPEMFAGVDEFVAGKGGAKYSPLQVAAWLDDLADKATANLAKGGAPRLWAVDIEIQAGIGRFFAAKFRSAIHWAGFEQRGDRPSLEAAIEQYKAAREAWAKLASVAKVYRPDVSYGYEYQLRGHWLDRLPAIDEDIARMEQRLAGATPGPGKIATSAPRRLESQWKCGHKPPAPFAPGKPIDVALSVADERPQSAVLRYRRVNQVERFAAIDMTPSASGFSAQIPAAYTRSPFPVQYYFELERLGMFPGIGSNLSGQPYFVVRQV